MQVYRSIDGRMDFRLNHEKACTIPVTINSPLQSPKLEMLRGKTRRGHTDIASYFPKGNGGNALSLGCGGGTDRAAIEHAGWKYYGVDWEPMAKGTDIYYADAHALPFVDSSFGFVFSDSVLEHIQHPYVFAMETFRVLKTGGVFIGNGAFLEPYHAGSFYHHSPLGIVNTLQTAGFEVELVAPQRNWNVLTAITRMGFFPWRSRYLLQPFTWFLNFWHKVFWGMFDVLEETWLGNVIKRGKKKPVSSGPQYKRISRAQERLYNFSGSFIWIARKP